MKRTDQLDRVAKEWDREGQRRECGWKEAGALKNSQRKTVGGRLAVQYTDAEETGKVQMYKRGVKKGMEPMHNSVKINVNVW